MSDDVSQRVPDSEGGWLVVGPGSVGRYVTRRQWLPFFGGWTTHIAWEPHPDPQAYLALSRDTRGGSDAQ